MKLKKINKWTDALRPFIRKFILHAMEDERTEEQVVAQIKEALGSPTHAVWLLEKDSKAYGYVFAQIMPTEYRTMCVLVPQLYFDPKAKFRLWKQLDEALLNFGKSHGANEIFFLTRRNPNAFIRLLNDGWEIDSFVLRRRNKNVSHGTNGRAPAHTT